VKGLEFSMPDDVRNFVDFYAACRGQKAPSLAHTALISHMNKHRLNGAQIEEYEAKYGKVPSAFRAARAVRNGGDSEGQS